jgi:hypothetical protein
MSVYKHACWPDNPELAGQPCGDLSSGIAWVDSEYAKDSEDSEGNPIAVDVRLGGFLSGSKRKYGETDPRVGDIEGAGLAHGVDEHTAP